MISRRLLGLALAGLSLAAAGEANAQALFPDFKALCLDITTGPKAVIAAADAAGWAPVTKEMDRRLQRGAEGRIKPHGDGGLVLLQAWTTKAKGEVQHLCSLRATPPDPDLAGALKDWVGVPPDKNLKDGMVAYSYVETDSGRRAMNGDLTGVSIVDMLSKFRLLMIISNAKVTEAVFVVDAPH